MTDAWCFTVLSFIHTYMKQSIPHTALMLIKYFKAVQARSYQVNNGKNANDKTSAGQRQIKSINQCIILESPVSLILFR